MDKQSSQTNFLSIFLALERPGKIIIFGMIISLMPIYLLVLIYLGLNLNIITSILITSAIGLPLTFSLAMWFQLCLEPLVGHILLTQAASKQEETWEDSDTTFYLSVSLSSWFMTITGMISVFFAFFMRFNIALLSEIAALMLIVVALAGLAIRLYSVHSLLKYQDVAVIADTLKAMKKARQQKNSFIAAKITAKSLFEEELNKSKHLSNS